MMSLTDSPWGFKWLAAAKDAPDWYFVSLWQGGICLFRWRSSGYENWAFARMEIGG